MIYECWQIGETRIFGLQGTMDESIQSISNYGGSPICVFSCEACCFDNANVQWEEWIDANECDEEDDPTNEGEGR